MRSLAGKSFTWLYAALTFILIGAYIYVRIRTAPGEPLIYTQWRPEIAHLFKIMAGSIQLLGLIIGATGFADAFKRWGSKDRRTLIRLSRASIVCGAAFFTPDLVRLALPALFGVS